MAKATQTRHPIDVQTRVRRGYFECRYGQLHVHNAMPPGGGFEEATPLLCLHDCPGSGRVFAGFLTLAGRDRSVYAPDLPGCGESDPPAPGAAVADYAAAIADFLDSLRLRQVDVLGQRAGGTVATELALTRPAQVGRVILVSAPLLTEAERQATRRSSPATDGPASWGSEAATHYPLRERLSRLPQRLLVLRPRDDLWEASGRVRETLPGARLIDLEEPPGELFAAAAARTADTVREFLRR